MMDLGVLRRQEHWLNPLITLVVEEWNAHSSEAESCVFRFRAVTHSSQARETDLWTN